MKRLSRAVGVALLACLAISPANAITITQGPLVFPGGSGNFNDTIAFGKFNTGFGTLTGVEISMTAAGFAQVNVYNFSGGAAGFFNANASVPVVVSGPAGVTISTKLLAGPLAGTVLAGQWGYFPGATTSYSASGNVPNANWGDYSWDGTGLGTFNLNALVSGGTYSGSEAIPGTLAFAGTETVTGTVTVKYTYDPVSVPDSGLTAMLLGAGMLALGFVRRMV